MKSISLTTLAVCGNIVGAFLFAVGHSAYIYRHIAAGPNDGVVVVTGLP